VEERSQKSSCRSPTKLNAESFSPIKFKNNLNIINEENLPGDKFEAKNGDSSDPN